MYAENRPKSIKAGNLYRTEAIKTCFILSAGKLYIILVIAK